MTMGMERPLDTAPKAQSMKEIIDGLGFIKIKISTLQKMV